MSDSFKISREMRGCYIVPKDGIRRVFGHVQKASKVTDAALQVAPEPYISVEFSSGRTVSSKDVDDILDDSLMISDRISRITIGVYRAYLSQQAAVRFVDRSDRPISFDIEGERHKSLALEEALSNEIKGMKAPYSQANLASYSFPLLITVWAPVSMAMTFLTYWAIFGLSSKYAGASWLIFSLFMFLIPPLSSWTFPGIVFDFGEGARRRNRIRYTVYGLVLFLVGGVSLDFIVSKMPWN